MTCRYLQDESVAEQAGIALRLQQPTFTKMQLKKDVLNSTQNDWKKGGKGELDNSTKETVAHTLNLLRVRRTCVMCINLLRRGTLIETDKPT